MKTNDLSPVPADPRIRPGTVRELVGIIFQSDSVSVLGAWVIRPVETLDQRFSGLARFPGGPPLAIHAGLHVRLADGREMVAEQLFGTLFEDFSDGLNWTPLDRFRARDHRGWDVTVPATCFRNVDNAAVEEAIAFLNRLEGRPFFGEDCTSMVERVFNKRRLFADSPLAHFLGFGGLRVGDPALPLLRPDAHVSPQAEALLRADALRHLPDPKSAWNAPSWRVRVNRGFKFLLAFIAMAGVFYYLRRRGSLGHG
ncbi:MAG TPA: hypothetical protein VGD78_14500 [Chthoniobacterales bacterium]